LQCAPTLENDSTFYFIYPLTYTTVLFDSIFVCKPYCFCGAALIIQISMFGEQNQSDIYDGDGEAITSIISP